MATLKQIAANRENGKNGGAKSVEGKRIVRWNAVQHGLLCREVVIRTGDGQEDRLEFDHILSELREDRQPRGMLEEMLVERMTVAYWRLCRAVRAEVGELRKKLDHARFTDISTRISRFEANKPFLTAQSSREEFKRTSLGTEHFIQELQAAREEVKRDGRLHRTGINAVLLYFGKNEDDGGTLCCFLNAVISAIMDGRPVPAGSEEMSIQFCQERLLKILDDELCKLRIVKGGLEEIEEDTLQATMAAASVPDTERYERLLRYETAIERQFYRAAHELERRQSGRRGLAVPPPIAVDVDLSQATS